MVPNDGSEKGINDLERFGFFVTYTDWFQLGIGLQRRMSCKRYFEHTNHQQDLKYNFGAFFVEARFRFIKIADFDIKATLLLSRNNTLSKQYRLDGILIESHNWREDAFLYHFTELGAGLCFDYTIGEHFQLYSQLSVTKTFVSWGGDRYSINHKEYDFQVDKWYIPVLVGIRYNFGIPVGKAVQ